jgi:CheY-like chemotaxis protein
MMNLFVDPLIYIYGLNFISSMIGFSFFLYWWYKYKKATPIYAYVTFLFLAIAIYLGGNVHARILLDLKDDPLSILPTIQHWTWTLRAIPLLIVQIGIVFLVAKRMKKTRKALRKLEEKRFEKQYPQSLLLVEDNPIVRRFLQKMFQECLPDIRVFSASRVSEAESIFNSNHDIGVVVSDMRLPGRSGFEFCRVVRLERPWVIIIGMTGYMDDFELWAARGIGFDDYFFKPFRVKDLIESLKKELEKLERWQIRGVQEKFGSDEVLVENTIVDDDNACKNTY